MNLEDLSEKHQKSYRLLAKILLAYSAPSESLAAQVIATRTLNIDRTFALWCMQELGRRRKLGEEFDFEGYIEEKINKIPKLDPKIKNNNNLGFSLIKSFLKNGKPNINQRNS